MSHNYELKHYGNLPESSLYPLHCIGSATVVKQTITINIRHMTASIFKLLPLVFIGPIIVYENKI